MTTIDVYRIPMSGPPQLATITPDLDGMQAAVGGMIEVITLVDGVDMYVDEEGKLKRGIQPNVNATRVVEHYRPGFSRRDVIYGDAIVAGMDEDGETVSVPDHIAAAITDLLKAEGVDA